MPDIQKRNIGGWFSVSIRNFQAYPCKIPLCFGIQTHTNNTTYLPKWCNSLPRPSLGANQKANFTRIIRGTHLEGRSGQRTRGHDVAGRLAAARRGREGNGHRFLWILVCDGATCQIERVYHIQREKLERQPQGDTWA